MFLAKASPTGFGKTSFVMIQYGDRKESGKCEILGKKEFADAFEGYEWLKTVDDFANVDNRLKYLHKK